MKSILFIFSGLPGSGKSTLSQYIASKYEIPYFRIDTIEQGLRDLCDFNVVGEGYELAYRLVIDNLKLGISTVVDSCNPIVLTRRRWEEVAENSKDVFVNIEIICSDKNEHRQRIKTRIADIENLKLPTWEEVESREFDPWESERIIIDTAHKSLQESQRELDEKIYVYLNENFTGIVLKEK